ncbi:MAG: hypothetical protein P8181_17360 [bacterium]
MAESEAASRGESGAASGGASNTTSKSASGDESGVESRGAPEAASITHSHEHAGESLHDLEGAAGTEPEEIDADTLAAISDIEQLVSMYVQAADDEERSLVVSRLLDVDVPAGVRLAIEFLGSDPPLLFRMTVVDRLEEATGQPVQYAIDEPFTAPDNQKAMAVLKRRYGIE